MRKTILISMLLASGALSACVSQPGQPGMLETQTGRALVGAGIGAVIADNQDENMLAGAAAGGMAGALSCAVPGINGCRYP
ncbi:hypothetical protein [Neogemmobacter tilapiae]|uniref:17 kDa surface antigen n=1 Tax=Neogemmobacter tilapiae TaxID=875041 RepID=A0A918TKY3_9RHOB|nr:hypothetical protein [Gemmobacter tilapiae]GHC49581.1 hypothetical protein GCM10007315_09720 [Gemmobacter tilapiae]